MDGAGRRWSRAEDQTISALYSRVHKAIDRNRDALERMNQSKESAGKAVRAMNEEVERLQVEKLELLDVIAAGPPETELHRQIHALQQELEDCRSQLNRSEMLRAEKAEALNKAMVKQRELQRDLNSAIAELDRLRMQLHLLRPLQPQGRPTPSAAPRQEAYPELEPPYSPRYTPPLAPPRPAPNASPTIAKAIALGKRLQDQEPHLLASMSHSRGQASAGSIAQRRRPSTAQANRGRASSLLVAASSSARRRHATPSCEGSGHVGAQWVDLSQESYSGGLKARERLEAEINQLRSANTRLSSAVAAVAVKPLHS